MICPPRSLRLPTVSETRSRKESELHSRFFRASRFNLKMYKSCFCKVPRFANYRMSALDVWRSVNPTNYTLQGNRGNLRNGTLGGVQKRVLPRAANRGCQRCKASCCADLVAVSTRGSAAFEERSSLQSACLPACLPVCLSACLPVWLYGCVAVWLYGCMAVWLYGFLFCLSFSVPLYLCISVYLSRPL